MSFTVNKLDVVFFQRDSNNTQYEQVNISGSDALFYLDSNGVLTAGRISDLLKSGGTTKASVKSLARPLLVGETMYSVDTVSVGLPNRLVRYELDPNNPLSYRVTYTQTWTKDTPNGIGIGKTDEEPFVNATLDISGTVIVTGSLTVTGIMYGSSSYALTASYISGSSTSSESASYSLTSTSASISNIAVSADFALLAGESLTSTSASISNIAVSADFALLSGESLTSTSASYALTSTSASISNIAVSADFALLAGESLTSTSASYSLTSTSASISNIAVSADFALLSGESLTSTSASYALTASYVSGSLTSSESSSYALSASFAIDAFIPYNGNRPIKRSGYVGVNVGGDDLEEFIENFFFPFVPATISINSSTLNYETGSQQTINLNGSITANDETLFYTGSVWKTIGVIVSGSFVSASSYSVNDVNVSSSCVYRTYFRVGWNGVDGNMSSSTKTVNFNYPYLYGTSSIEGLTGSALYQALLKDYTLTSYATNKTYNIVGVSTYVYFAYPSGSRLISIKDPNNFEVLGSFGYTGSVPVTSSGLFSDWKSNYTVYRLLLSANPGGNFQFNFT